MAYKLKKNIILWYLRFSELLLRFQAFWKVTLLCGVGGTRHFKWSCCLHVLDCVPLKVKMSWHYRTPETTHPVTQHHIPGDLNLWVKIRASCTSKRVLLWFAVKKLLHSLNKTTWIQVWVKWTCTGLSRTSLLPAYMSHQVHVLCVVVFELYLIFVFTCFIAWNILFQL